jgi:predicted ATPase
MFDVYVQSCNYDTGTDDEGDPLRIPAGSRIITSDDIFDYMLCARTNNEIHEEKKEAIEGEWASIRFGETVHYRGLEDYEALHYQNLARRKKSRAQYTETVIGKKLRLYSNGETALEFFRTALKNDTLYCLDEPENSLSPKMQLELAQLLEELARFCGCQLVIATHSPFLLAMEGACVYDLDACPAGEKNWWELENPKIYYEFFKRHASKFE